MALAMPQRLGRRRPAQRTGRQEEIARVGRAARAQGQGQGAGPAIRRMPGGNLPRGASIDPGFSPPSQRAGISGQRRGGPGVGQARKAPGLEIGGQLQRRVKSGAITTEQAERTARERQTLKKQFGDDWRKEIGGGGGKLREARQKLAENPNDPRLIALNKSLQTRRQKALETARGGGSDNGGTTAPTPRRGRGRVNPRGTGMMNPPGEGPARRPRRRGRGY